MKRTAAAIVGLFLATGSGVARADRQTPWDRGRVHLSIALATEQAFGESYFMAGGGIGYYVLTGLEVGLHADHWFGGDPAITDVSPEVRYVAVPLGLPVLPYVGAFYTHYFIGDPFDDLDTIGARLGLLWNQGGGFVLGGGAVIEQTISECTDDCTSIYPEVTISFSF